MPTPRTRLATRRRALGYSQEQLAQVLDVTHSTVARWEQGHSTPLARHRRPLAELLELGMADLEQLILEGGEQATPRVLNEHPLPAVPEWLGLFAMAEQSAESDRTLELVVVPGLLQTRDYATALEAAHYVPVSDYEISRRVEARLARQAVLHREPNPLQLEVVLAEGALRELVGGPEVMAGQCDHLVTMARQANVELQVLPANGQVVSSICAFHLFTSPGSPAPYLACGSDLIGVNYHETRSAIDAYGALFAHLCSVALSPADTIRFIKTVKESHR
jgi:transcriptional regulator with XRE-family HTH domain